MNNKGFMMAEVVVVSSIILVTLVGLYTSYNKIISIYNERVDYYDIRTLYELANIRNNTSFVGVSTKTQITPKVYYLKPSELNELSEEVINETYKDYLKYISTSVNFDGVERILVMERCIDRDNCKYAYLEVYENEETPE